MKVRKPKTGFQQKPVLTSLTQICTFIMIVCNCRLQLLQKQVFTESAIPHQDNDHFIPEVGRLTTNCKSNVDAAKSHMTSLHGLHTDSYSYATH